MPRYFSLLIRHFRYALTMLFSLLRFDYYCQIRRQRHAMPPPLLPPFIGRRIEVGGGRGIAAAIAATLRAAAATLFRLILIIFVTRYT